jgi:SAM-dependent methyltransferase
MKIDRWLPLLVDPQFKKPLTRIEHSLVNEHNGSYAIMDGKPDFIGTEKTASFAKQRDVLDNLKTVFKNRFGKYYVFLIYIISPAYIRIHWPTLSIYLNHLAGKICKERDFVIQIGSGNDRLAEEILNIDIFNYAEVDMIADCTNLPFADNSIDCVISNAVLEHVTDPEAFIKEAYRVLKPGGLIITGVPFMQGFHASPNDFYRWTDKGLSYMHAKHKFNEQRIFANSGPTSGFLWILQEWLSIVLSFNIALLYQFWWFVFTLVLMPIKFLDILLIHFKQAHKINSFYTYIGVK